MISQPLKIRLAVKIFGKRNALHAHQILMQIKTYKRRHETKRIPFFLVYYFYKFITNNVPTKKEIVSVNGYQMKIIPKDQGISKEVLVFKTHEPLTTSLVNREIKSGMICIEVGSNIGYYALLESKLVGNNGIVIAIEPSPLNFEYLKYNLSLNNASNVRPFNVAIGDLDTQVNFLISDLSNWCKIIDITPSNSNGNVITVPLVKLDTFVSQNSLPSIDLIRMDIEGYEYNAYNGMVNTIERFKPDLLIEVHVTTMGLEKTGLFLNKLKSDGYEIKYYIEKRLDRPWVNNMKKDVEMIGIARLIEMLAKKKIPDLLMLYLINKGKTR